VTAVRVFYSFGGDRQLRDLPPGRHELSFRFSLAARSAPEMLLISNRICFRQERQEFRIEFFGRSEAKMMNVVARRNCLYLVKSPAPHGPRQNQMSNEPGFPRRDLSERHAGLERNSRLFGQDYHRPKNPHRSNKFVKKLPRFGRLVQKMMLQVELATRV